MQNEEIIQLRGLKKKLVEKAIELKNKLKDHENGRYSLINTKITLPADNEDHKPSKSQSDKYRIKLCEIAGQVTGITFKEVHKRWSQDDTFIYTAKVVTKTISFCLELTVDSMHLDDLKINNIMCHFTDIDNCYLFEIFPWFDKMTKMKNFSLLMSAFSDYNKNHIVRSKIVDNLESKKYATIEENTQENGGILLHMYSPTNTKENYIIFQWTLKFMEPTWRIEHFFTVKSTEIGIKFSEENRTLLKEFCDIGLTKDKLNQLWHRLCSAIDIYAKDINI
ncbi:uncharacterized protein LOC114930393 [Nylanderia fulva]|uniref:uncharacterized protein LOC114930393 n=1 Tax=Nylanderia fulva TaxID=613905 RepID=UPI0010FB6F68|nr:uncharacterized protein LOC114930393 [Nylanderia fulva]